MVLQIPIAIIKPGLEDLQNYFSQVLNNIIDTHKYICMWGQKDRKRKPAIKRGLYIL